MITSQRIWIRRLTNGTHPMVKFIHSVQAFGMMHELADLKRIVAELEASRELREFHEGKRTELPDFYHRRFDARLGPYAELISRADRRPVHTVRQAPAPAAVGA